MTSFRPFPLCAIIGIATSRPVSQKERKKLWHRQKLLLDKTYRESKADAQRKWSSANDGYWKEYRANHPNYVKRNREKQRERNRKRPRKRDTPATPVIAKMDALVVEIGVVSGG